MRNAIVILVVLAAIILSAYLWAKKALDKINYNIKFASGFKEVLNGISGGVGNVNVDLKIDNKNNFNIPVNGLYAEIYYNGNMVAKSTQPHVKFIVPKNGSINVRHSVTVILSDSSFSAVGSIIQNKPTEFMYKISGSVWFVPIRYTGKFNT